MAYSNDLRIRAVKSYTEDKLGYKEVALRFKIGIATLHGWVSRYRKSGHVEAKKPTGRPRVLCKEQTEAFQAMLLKNADKTLEQLSAKWCEQTGQKLSVFCISRSLRRFGLTLKKRRFVPKNVSVGLTKKSVHNILSV